MHTLAPPLTTVPLRPSPPRFPPRYLLLCRGNIPIAFDLDKVRASVVAAAAAATVEGASKPHSGHQQGDNK